MTEIVTDYRLTVKIAKKDLDILLGGGYKLCLTKGVKSNNELEPGNVVYSEIPSERLFEELEFTWDEDYKVFMSDAFKAGSNITVNTPKYVLTRSELADVDPGGNVEIKIGTDQNALQVLNHWKNGGLVGVANHDRVSNNYNTIYLSRKTPLNKARSLTPVQYMGLFFHENWSTDTMIDVMQTEIFYVDLTSKLVATVCYENGEWRLEE